MKTKRILLFLLALLPMMAWADASGTCGNNLTWTYVDATKTLTISGTGMMQNYVYASDMAPWYGYRYAIQNVVIEEGVTSIGNYAFYECSAFTSISIPNSVTSIGYRAFLDCTGLTSITIPNSVTSIGGGGAFYNTGWYNNQPDGMVYAGLVAYKYKGTMPENTSILIKDGTKGIADYAFYGCSGLTSITIPNSVTNIGYEAFSYCNGLTSITIPNSVTSIEYNAFSGCTSLTSITIPNSVTSIGERAFYGCSGLTYITIPNSVTSIGERAFSGCTSLTSITIPNSVTSIEYNAFSGCTSLTSITIPNSVTSIGGYAFYGCSGLTSITILNSVTSIGDYAFSDCNNLSRVISLATNPCILNASNIFPVFFKTSGLLYIPAGTRLAYIEKGWNKYFGNIIEMEEGEPTWLTIKDAEQGQSQLKCEAGKSYTLRFKASNGWRIHSVSFKGADVTSWLSVDGEFTTPAMSASTELIVTYEQIATSVKAELNAEDDMRVVVINDEIVVKNAAPGTPIRIFDLSGKLIGSATATEGVTKVETAMSDKVVIVKVGERSVKVAR